MTVHHLLRIVFGSDSCLAVEHIWPLRIRFCCQEISVECTLLFLMEALYVQYKPSCCPPSSPLLYTKTKRQREWIIHLFIDIHASSIQCDCFLLENTLQSVLTWPPAWLEFTGQIHPLYNTDAQMRNQLWVLLWWEREQIENVWFLSCLIWLSKAGRHSFIKNESERERGVAFSVTHFITHLAKMTKLHNLRYLRFIYI